MQPTQIRNVKRIRLAALAAAALAAGVFTQTASAQFYRDNSGAKDGSTLAGSGGRNVSTDRFGARFNGNQIITGNVSGGKHFRGFVPYRDSSELRISTSLSASRDFIRNSAGVPRDFSPVDANTPAAFYSDDRATPTPQGYVPTAGATGGFVATRAVSPGETSNPYNVSPTWSASVISGRAAFAPGPNGLDDRAMASQYNSPLMGAEPVQPGEIPGGPTNLSATDLDAMRRLGVSPSDIQRMQEELASPGAKQTQQNQQDQRPAEGSAQSDQSASQALPGGTPLPANRLDASAGSSARVDAQNTGQGSRQRLLVPPEKQSELYRQLVQRFERQRQMQGEPTEAEAAQQLQQLRQAQEGTIGKPAPHRTSPGATPPAAGDKTPTPPPAGETPDAVKVKSLGEGVQSPSFKKLLEDAEAMMREGKFESALQQYRIAEQVAPNNPLISLGRAHAELGGAMYRQAEEDIRASVAAEPALLGGQYDLRAAMGEDRLGKLVDDLKSVQTKEPGQLRAPLLLAYIAYNSGSPDQAQIYLTQAEKIAPDDALVKQMRQTWKLTSAEVNK